MSLYFKDPWDLFKPPVKIGNTPVRLLRVSISGLHHTVALKEESFNMFGSIKDRIAWGLLVDAHKKGRFESCSQVVDVSSGNYGVALAGLGNHLGLHVSIIAPENISTSNRTAILESGAELHIVSPLNGENAYNTELRVATDMASKNQSVFLNQYGSQANPNTHKLWTAPEALSDVQRYNTIFVAASSGGTAQGFINYLTEYKREDKLIVVDSPASNAFQDSEKGVFQPSVPGFGSSHRSNFSHQSDNYNVVRVPEPRAMAVFFVFNEQKIASLGPSSCAIFRGCLDWLSYQEEPKKVLCICPDGAEKYQNYLSLNEVDLEKKYNGFIAIKSTTQKLFQNVNLQTVNHISEEDIKNIIK